MNRFLLSLMIMLLFVSGCVATTAQETTIPDSPTGQVEGDSALIPVTPPTEDAGASDDLETPMPAEGATAAEISITPVTVDLSQITPEPLEGGELIEMPVPGAPNPRAKLIQEVTLDLSQRLNLDVDQIELVQVTETMWRDSSLGCPQPGMRYLMALTSGYQIVLKAQGKHYFYHTGETSTFILCPDGKPVESSANPDQ